MPRTRALIIGGSIAGMCAARVLSRSFDEVVVIERDAYPEGIAERPGVPQARHVHALLARGWLEFERLFPGFHAQMRAGGALELDFGIDVATLRPPGWQERMPSGIRVCLATRELTEAILRELFRKTPSVVLRERAMVTGLLSSGGRVTGARVKDLDSDTGAEIEAELVIDASGRASRAPEWLRALGREPPAESVIDSFAGYSSRWFRAPPPERWPSAWWWKGLWIDPLPPAKLMGGVLFPVEGSQWIVTLFGYSRQYPPDDEAGFSRALRALRSPAIAEAVALAEPISGVYCSRSLSNRFRRYERLADVPPGFIAVGDSVCAFNPIYGQGMTAATLSAAALESTLARMDPRSPGFARAFFREQVRVLADPWNLAVGADCTFEATVGERPVGASLLKIYTDELLIAMTHDPEILRRASAVYAMLKPNAALVTPALVKRVARQAIARFMRRRAGEPPIPPMPA